MIYHFEMDEILSPVVLDIFFLPGAFLLLKIVMIKKLDWFQIIVIKCDYFVSLIKA